MKCLEKRPEKRYESGRALAEDLERLLRGEPILARPIGAVERTLRWTRRNPAWATLIGVSALALFALFFTGTWFTRQLQKELRATEAARKEATDAQSELRLRLIRARAESIDSDLRQLASVPRVVASALGDRGSFTDQRLQAWLRKELDAEPLIFGMAIAFEPGELRADIEDYALYAFRGSSGIEIKQLLPPEYTPLYRQWDWYRNADGNGTWSEPYVDEGGGEIPMVTLSVPIERAGRRAGVVTADLSLGYFRSLEESMRKSRFGGGSYAFVVTSLGTVVKHPRPGLSFPSPGSHRPGMDDPKVAKLWAHILGGATGAERGVDIATGSPAELLFAPVKSAGWSCVAVLPE